MKTLAVVLAMCLPLAVAAQDAATPAPEKLRFDAMSIEVPRPHAVDRRLRRL